MRPLRRSKPHAYRHEHAKRAEAEARNEAWAALSPAEQLAALDRRGVKAAKQRKRIHGRA